MRERAAAGLGTRGPRRVLPFSKRCLDAETDASPRPLNPPQAEHIFTHTAHTEGVWDLAVLPDAESHAAGAPAAAPRAVTCSSDGTIRIWNVGEDAEDCECTLTGAAEGLGQGGGTG
jgi:WD40 repeat protein